MPSPSSHRHHDVRAEAGGVAAASTRRHPPHHASNTRPPASSSADPLPAATRAASRSPRLDTPSPASSSADVAIGHCRHAPAGITIRAPQPYARAVAACGSSARGVQSPSLLLDRCREWQAQGQLPSRGRAGRGTRAQSRAVRAGRAHAWAARLAA
eukprot:scaffold8561_cov106-Isochrysis_galbana.AAC.3